MLIILLKILFYKKWWSRVREFVKQQSGAESNHIEQ